MAKMMKVNTDDVLREYRIRALTSPLSAYEMTHLDREMGDILSRTDLATDRKMKLFYDALNKFQVTRKNYIHQSTVVGNQQQQQQPSVKPDDAVKNETKMEQSQSINDDSVLASDGFVTSTPVSSHRQLSPSLFSDIATGTTDAPKKDVEQDVLTVLGDAKTLTRNIISELNSTADGVIYSPGVGGKKRVIGSISDIAPIVERLTHPTKLRKSVKQNNNSELVDFVTDVINSKYIARLPQKSKSSVKDLYPNLQPARAGGSVPPSRAPRSPLFLRSQVRSQVGKGPILKIFFNKWNQLLA